MSQIARSAEASRDRGQESLERAAAMAQILAESGQAVRELTAGVTTSLVETEAVQAEIGRLDETCRSIAKRVDAVALIAVQTGMLAVSGSVEAARAGEAGRGFAIVSDDIRKLARQSSASAERVRDVVETMRDRIASVRRDLEQICTVTRREVGRNEQIMSRIEAMAGQVETLRGGNGRIVDGAAAIFAAVQEVVKGTQQIAAVAEQSSSAAAQASAAARQQAHGAEDLAAAIEEIASLAGEIDQATA